MRFVEMTGFTREVQSLLTPDEYRKLQNALATRATRVDTIPGTGGLQKCDGDRYKKENEAVCE